MFGKTRPNADNYVQGPGRTRLQPRSARCPGQRSRDEFLIPGPLESGVSTLGRVTVLRKGATVTSPAGEMLPGCLHSIRELVFLSDN